MISKADFSSIMIVCDCDGTLLNTACTIPQNNIEAIKYFCSRGGHFVIATGRPLRGAAHIIQALPSSLGLSVLFNGALIFDASTHQVVHMDPLPVKAAPIVTFIIRQFGSSVGIEGFTIHDSFILQDHPITRYHFEILHEPYSFRNIDDIPDGQVLKLFVTGENHRLNTVRTALLDKFPGQIQAVLSGSTFLEIISPTSSKGHALSILRQAYPDIRLFCGVGDGFNDIPLLKSCDLAFIPSNGVAQAKACGTSVCSCDEGAIQDVISYLERHIL